MDIVILSLVSFLIGLICRRKKKLEKQKPSNTSNTEFPHFELMGLTIEEARKKYRPSHSVIMNLLWQNNIICGFKFHYSDFYHYKKYYEMLDSFAKNNQVKILDDVEGEYFIYKIVDFEPLEDECGVYREDNKYELDTWNYDVRQIANSKKERDWIESKCNEIITNALNRVCFEKKVERFKERNRRA